MQACEESYCSCKAYHCCSERGKRKGVAGRTLRWTGAMPASTARWAATSAGSHPIVQPVGSVRLSKADGRAITNHAPRRRKVGSKEAGDLETQAGPFELYEYAPWMGCRGRAAVDGMPWMVCRDFRSLLASEHLGVGGGQKQPGNALEIVPVKPAWARGESKCQQCQQKPLRPCAPACTWFRDRGRKLTLNLDVSAHSPSFLNTSTSTIIEVTCGAVPVGSCLMSSAQLSRTCICDKSVVRPPFLQLCTRCDLGFPLELLVVPRRMFPFATLSRHRTFLLYGP